MDCHEVPVEECLDELQETPFLVDTEKCEDVPKLVCTEVRASYFFEFVVKINVLPPDWGASSDPSVQDYWQAKDTHCYRKRKVGPHYQLIITFVED